MARVSFSDIQTNYHTTTINFLRRDKTYRNIYTYPSNNIQHLPHYTNTIYTSPHITSSSTVKDFNALIPEYSTYLDVKMDPFH